MLRPQNRSRSSRVRRSRAQNGVAAATRISWKLLFYFWIAASSESPDTGNLKDHYVVRVGHGAIIPAACIEFWLCKLRLRPNKARARTYSQAEIAGQSLATARVLSGSTDRELCNSLILPRKATPKGQLLRDAQAGGCLHCEGGVTVKRLEG